MYFQLGPLNSHFVIIVLTLFSQRYNELLDKVPVLAEPSSDFQYLSNCIGCFLV